MESLVLLVLLAVLAGPVLGIIAIALVQTHKRETRDLRQALSVVERRLVTLETPEPKATMAEPVPKKREEPVSTVSPPPLAQEGPPPLVTPVSQGRRDQAPEPEIPILEEAPVIHAPPSESAAPKEIHWKSWLRRLHLWPPEQETSGEIGLAAWWTTRIGILIGVIAVVFLGVYVNRMTSPWIRFVELLGISAGVFSLGWWLEKRWGRFGDLVSIGGLAMLYFTAYAAHGVAAVQVTTQAWLGALFQLIALTIMLLWSDRKRDSGLAATAIFLGYVSCAFAAQHGLPMMTLAGLVLLGLIGSLLHPLRGWRLPITTSIGGSYGGLLLFSLTHQDSLTLLHLLAATITLMTGFSFALWRQGRSETPTLWTKRLALGQGTLAALVLVAAAWLISPGQLHLVYLTLFVAFGVQAWLSWRGQFLPVLFPTWFLKASTFLTLYLAAEFEGPTLWLSLAAQGFGILWTMRQRESAHRRWLALGFVALWGVSFVIYARDAASWLREPFILGDPRRIVAWVYLFAATLTATLFHQRWWSRASQNEARGLERECGVVMAVLTGIGFILTLLSPADQLAPLFVAVGLIGSMTVLGWWRQSIVPLLSGGAILLAGHLRLWAIDLPVSTWWPQVAVGVMLGVAGFVLAEHAITLQGKLRPAAASRVIRVLTTLWTGSVLVSGCVLAWQARSFWPGGGLVSSATVVLASLWCITGSRRFPGTQNAYHGALLGGVGLVQGGFISLTSDPLLAPWILLASTGILALLMRVTRDRLVSAAIAGPALLGIGSYLFPQGWDAWPLVEDMGLGLALMIALGAAAWRIHQSVKDATQKRRWICLDALIHGASLAVFFQGTGRHLDGPWHWLVIGAATLATLVISRRLPFPALKWVAWLPATLVILSELRMPYPPEMTLAAMLAYWLGAGLLALSWRMQRKGFEATIGIWVSATGLGWAAWRTLEGGAEFAALAAIGLGYAVAWHRRREAGTPAAAMVMGGFSVVLSLAFLTNLEGHETFGFLWIVTTSLFLAIQGWLLKTAPSRLRCWQDPARSWGHAAAALLISQAALLMPALGLTEVATACWGIVSVALFLGGLAGGIRAYRMVGLLGLLACLGRMFAVDVQDTFYRIIAFAVVGCVLLGVGYLYTRFRGWIESHDEREAQPSTTTS